MMYTIAFIVTFVIGGVSGVLLALPPADYLMHNSTFLIAHFHNMLIPGALFGYFAGLNFWFPKAFGFRLDERWGRRSFWCWLIGFYLAFMPLYVLGFMGMSRRMEHYDTAAWQPFLIVAAVGAVFVLFGLAFLIVQIVVSIGRRAELRDASGDPWGGRTLEWLTSSPPAPYNFAIVPEVRGRDAFLDMKERGVAYQRPQRYEDIVMAKNGAIGVTLGGLSFVLAFAVVWYIWWLAIAAAVLAVLAVVGFSSNDDVDTLLPADEIERIEVRRLDELARLPRAGTEEEPSALPGSPLPGIVS
jgi:cytochrome o ubiquinol oxidase subunit 1